MPRKSTSIVLGDLSVEIPQFTFGQLERIADWLTGNGNSPATSLGDIVRSYREILAIAFERSKPPIDPEKINELEMDVDELRKAGAALLQLAGLQPVEGPVDPEVKAPDGASQTISTGSSENSQPDANTRLN